MIPVAPRIVNEVAYVMMSKQLIHFVLLRTTNYCSSTTPYYQGLLRTTKSSTPGLLRTTKY